MTGVTIEKPAADDREYKVIVLANGLEALLISDATTDKASAALDVNVGSFSDPENLPGLAHFLEHLLFMGTKKYPSENEYSQFLTDHAGMYNAYTSSEETNYYFDVAHAHFYGALDRFAQFFVAPLFANSAKNREILAVDSENKKNLNSDAWRLHQLDKSLADIKHPYHKFSTGNYTTLGQNPEAQNVDVRDELIKFYEAHYSAQLMKLVVLGREPLATLESWVVELFSPVPGPPRVPAVYPHSPIGPKQLGTLVQAKPVMDLKVFEVSFLIPDQRPLYRTQPSHYFSHLIGHESADSLLHYFKSLSLANGLTCGSSRISEGYAVFHIEVELTSLGVERWQEILAYIFEYIAMLKEQGPQEWFFNELKSMSKAGFLFKQKSKPATTTSELARSLQRKEIPRANILSYNVLHEYHPEMFHEFISYLNVDNVKALLVSQSLEGLDSTEEWYGTQYRSTRIDGLLNELRYIKPSGRFHMLKRNEFVPENFDVIRPETVKEPAVRPTLLVHQPGYLLWHKKDDTFFIPKAHVQIRLNNNVSSEDIAHLMLTELLVLLVNDYLNDTTYYAEVAGLSSVLTVAQNGIDITLDGFNDKLANLARVVSEALKNFKVLESRFDVMKERLSRGLRNSQFAAPYTQLNCQFSSLVIDRVWTPQQRLDALEKATAADVTNHHARFLAYLNIEILIVGNVSTSGAQYLGQTVRDALGAQPSARVLSGSRQLPRGREFHSVYNLADPENTNSAIDYRLQIGDSTNLRLRTVLAILAQIIKEPVFDQLRTKEQLGYVVGSNRLPLKASLWLRIFAQSEETTEYLENRIEYLLASLETLLENLSEAEYQRNVHAVIVQNLESFKNLREEASHYSAAISTGTYYFTRQYDIAKLAQEIKKEEVLHLFKTSVRGPERYKLVVHLKAAKVPERTLELLMSRNVPVVAQKYGLTIPSDVYKNDRSKDVDAMLEHLSKSLQDQVTLEGVSKTTVAQFIAELRQRMEAPQQPMPIVGTGITDAQLFKATLEPLPLSRPVVDLSEFEAEDSKL